MPMLMTALQSGCTRAASMARSREGSPPAMIVVTPGPAARRASTAKPVTAKTGRPPGANLTFRFPLRGSETDAAVQN